MHNIDAMTKDGQIAGWIEALPNGCPSKVILERKDLVVDVFATRKRPDVFAAGYSLYCGFGLKVTGPPAIKSCTVKVGSERKELSISMARTGDLLHTDDISSDKISGWVNIGESLHLLAFHHTQGVFRAELFIRSDINNHLGTPSNYVHGFSASGLDVESIYAININNKIIHWVSPEGRL